MIRSPSALRGLRCARGGFTLIEVLVMSAIGILLLGVLYAFFVQSHADTGQMDQRLKSVQGAHLLVERIETDVKQLVCGENRSKVLLDVEVTSDGGATDNVLSFFRVDGDATTPRGIRAERLEYRFDPATKRVLLNGKALPLARFRAVRFDFQKRDPKAVPPVEADVLRVVASGVADELADKPDDQVPEQKRSTVVVAIGLTARTAGDQHKYWCRNPSGIPE